MVNNLKFRYAYFPLGKVTFPVDKNICLPKTSAIEQPPKHRQSIFLPIELVLEI